MESDVSFLLLTVRKALVANMRQRQQGLNEQKKTKKKQMLSVWYYFIARIHIVVLWVKPSVVFAVVCSTSLYPLLYMFVCREAS